MQLQFVWGSQHITKVEKIEKIGVCVKDKTLELDSNTGFKHEKEKKKAYNFASCFLLFIHIRPSFYLHCYCFYSRSSTTTHLCNKNCVFVPKAYNIMFPCVPLLYS